ncbi:hypothetical protein LTR37_014891 [Vermiconidia calcicola]|uniref:Uncharacterized protein n=1 Tax=Vermiconidia calcicola TaxID=1690605 RepID=A0ACC3MS52_9PEZI|nr:hypothetical protein LTR37_014891 [Vermiconidia calcicola]
MADMDTYDEQRGHEGEYSQPTAGDKSGQQNGYDGHNDRDYTRDRSRSPGGDRDGDTRIRDEPMNGRGDRRPPPDRGDSEDGATNPGSNLFVTGIHPRLSEQEITRIFEKYGQVEKCNIMKDPHTRESRGFGFVKMVTGEEADAAKEALQGEVYEGRTLSIEKARRARPRTPTPGKYFGPPKRDDAPRRGGGGGYRDRYEDRGGYGRRDDRYGDRRGGGGGYRDRYEDRGYGGRGGGDDYAPRGGGDRYGGGGGGGGGGRYRDDDRYSGGDRRGGGYGGSYDRPPRGAPPAEAAGYAGAARDPPPPRDYEERRRTYD